MKYEERRHYNRQHQTRQIARSRDDVRRHATHGRADRPALLGFHQKAVRLQRDRSASVKKAFAPRPAHAGGGTMAAPHR